MQLSPTRTLDTVCSVYALQTVAAQVASNSSINSNLNATAAAIANVNTLAAVAANVTVRTVAAVHCRVKAVDPGPHSSMRMSTSDSALEEAL